MMSLPFSRVAILEPSLSFIVPHKPFLDRQMHSDLRRWIAQIRLRGADACYPRLHGMLRDTALQVLDFLSRQSDLAVLAPADLFDPEFKVAAWHHRSDSQGLLPVGDFLQGISCHGFSELQAAVLRGFDYAFLSPIFSTATHPEVVPLGLEVLQACCVGVGIPVIALGGVDDLRGLECLRVGAAGWAGIRFFE